MADTNLRKNIIKKAHKEQGKETVLEMSQAIHLDIISLRVPADPNMFVTICSDDVLFIVGKKECTKGGCVAKDQLPS
jgi:hypothetical protein